MYTRIKTVVIWIAAGVLVSYMFACAECVLFPNGVVGPVKPLPLGGKTWEYVTQPGLSGFNRFDAEPLIPLPSLPGWSLEEVAALKLPGTPSRTLTVEDAKSGWWPIHREEIDCYGWPFKAWGLKYGTRCWQWQRFSVLAGIPLPGEALRPRRYPLDEVPNALPIAPLVGLLLNAPLYALLAFGAWQGLLAARRARRRRRGLCVACGYPTGSAGVCPECGRARVTPASTPATMPRC